MSPLFIGVLPKLALWKLTLNRGTGGEKQREKERKGKKDYSNGEEQKTNSTKRK